MVLYGWFSETHRKIGGSTIYALKSGATIEITYASMKDHLPSGLISYTDWKGPHELDHWVSPGRCSDMDYKLQWNFDGT